MGIGSGKSFGALLHCEISSVVVCSVWPVLLLVVVVAQVAYMKSIMRSRNSYASLVWGTIIVSHQSVVRLIDNYRIV